MIYFLLHYFDLKYLVKPNLQFLCLNFKKSNFYSDMEDEDMLQIKNLSPKSNNNIDLEALKRKAMNRMLDKNWNNTK